jgi:hypothetical protein
LADDAELAAVEVAAAEVLDAVLPPLLHAANVSAAPAAARTAMVFLNTYGLLQRWWTSGCGFAQTQDGLTLSAAANTQPARQCRLRRVVHQVESQLEESLHHQGLKPSLADLSLTKASREDEPMTTRGHSVSANTPSVNPPGCSSGNRWVTIW